MRLQISSAVCGASGAIILVLVSSTLRRVRSRLSDLGFFGLSLRLYQPMSLSSWYRMMLIASLTLSLSSAIVAVWTALLKRLIIHLSSVEGFDFPAVFFAPCFLACPKRVASLS